MFHTVGSGMPASGNGGQQFGDGEHGIGDGAPSGGFEGPQAGEVTTPPPLHDGGQPVPHGIPPQLPRFLTPIVMLA